MFTTTRKPRPRGALRYECPLCRAEVGEPCRTFWGREEQVPHWTRTLFGAEEPEVTARRRRW